MFPGVIEQSLPRDLAFLTVPVTEGLRNLTADVANDVIRSDAFAGIWRQALRLSHNAASLVLSTEGKVAIDLNEAAEAVKILLGQNVLLRNRLLIFDLVEPYFEIIQLA